MLKHKRVWAIVAVLVAAAGMFLAYHVYTTNLAHTTFEKYYAFRGCVQLVEKTDTYGICRLADGSAIKIILINGKWYLEGDGPGVW